MMQYRTDGMEYALRIVEKGGVEELRKEVRARMASGVSLRMTKEEIDEASLAIKQRCQDAVKIMAVLTLHDEFDFGPKRAWRFIDRFETKTDVLLEDYATWGDYQQIIKDEMGIDLELRWNG